MTTLENRTMAWVGPDPVRVEAAHASLAPDRLSARGASLSGDYALDWALDTSAGWVTRHFSVRVRGDGWARSLELDRDPEGRWRAQRASDGPPELIDLVGAEHALDCDLALCPFTNTMPVLRHGLVHAARREEDRSIELEMAWVTVPELEVQVVPQRYTAGGPAADGGALIHFSSDDFHTTIEFGGDGLVREYPELAHRLDT